MTRHPIGAERRLQALRHALGPDILAALESETVVEILVNPDGRIVLDHQGRGRADTGVVLTADARDRAIRLIADHVGEPVTSEQPRLAGVLPSGERFQGLLPPVASAPTFSIRKRPGRIWTLDDYVRDGAMSEAQARILQDAVGQRLNILVSGGTGSGKTTLANALLAEPGFAADRVFLIEDTPELLVSAWDRVAVMTRRTPPIGISDLVRDALRMRPDRIVIGEMRDGPAVLDTLKCWNTGHPGGLSTVHANSAFDVVRRLQDLLGEVMANPRTRLIGEAVDRIVHIARTPSGRRLEGVFAVRCELDQEITLTPLAQE